MYLKQLFFCALIFSETKFSLLQDRRGDGWDKLSEDAVDYGHEQATRGRSKRREGATTTSPSPKWSTTSRTTPRERCTEEPEKRQDPMHVFTQEGSIWAVSLKAGSIIVEPDKNEKTTGTVTGPIFGDDNFKFHNFEFLWDIDEERDYVEMLAIVHFYNDRYVSYSEALDHPDGITQLQVPIDANMEGRGNDKFIPFSRVMGYIKNPGDNATIKSEDSYSFFKNFPEQTTFDYYDGPFYDKFAGQIYPHARIIQLPPNEKSNYISRDQFIDAFAYLIDTNEELLRKTIPPPVKGQRQSHPRRVTGLKVSPARG